jgi:hypothetical protein
VNTLFRSLRTENGDLRGRTGSGEPGLYTLLGGTGTERDAASGSGASGGGSPLYRGQRDVRLGAAAAAAARDGRPAAGGGYGRTDAGRPKGYAK